MTRALIVVDAQNDFTEDGALPVQGGNAVCDRISTFLDVHSDDYACIVFTLDAHVDPGDHFADEPDYVDTWPHHCVKGTLGQELHPLVRGAALNLLLSRGRDIGVFEKGNFEAAYSGFEGKDEHGTSLAHYLAHYNTTEIDVVGLALSHCVKATALDAVHYFPVKVNVLLDLTEPVTPEMGEEAKLTLAAAGVNLIP